MAVGDHLERSQTILVELENSNSPDIAYERQAAADLVESNRLFRLTAASAGDTATASLLEDLERVLLEISNSPSEMSRRQLQDSAERNRRPGNSIQSESVRLPGTGAREKGSNMNRLYRNSLARGPLRRGPVGAGQADDRHATGCSRRWIGPARRWSGHKRRWANFVSTSIWTSSRCCWPRRSPLRSPRRSTRRVEKSRELRTHFVFDRGHDLYSRGMDALDQRDYDRALRDFDQYYKAAAEKKERARRRRALLEGVRAEQAGPPRRFPGHARATGEILSLQPLAE